MSELVLVKQPNTFEIHSRVIQGEQVIGVSSPQSRPFIEYGYHPTGAETEEGLTGLDDYTAGKFLEFYERCRVAKPEDRPFYNCHLLAWYIIGAVAELERYDRYDGKTISHGMRPLEPGKTYAVRASTAGLPHSMIGIDTPERSLSVLGDCSPLFVTNNTDLVSAYNGTSIVRTIPKTAFHAPRPTGIKIWKATVGRFCR
jgi:hypothetical protein